MKYENTVRGTFIERPNRFIARVTLNGRTETVHVRNTGRCRELLLPGADVILSVSDNPNRKTKYDLIAVEKQDIGWINIDSQAPNTLVREWLESDPPLFPDITRIRPEYTYGSSRLDFYLESGSRKILMEVKGCTLEINKTGYFPDAPTERGVKHLYELINAVHEGYESYIAFVIPMPGITKVLPNRVTHPQFGDALDEAQKAGVHVLFLSCNVKPDELSIAQAHILESEPEDSNDSTD